ncbi:MAG: hypothetical protein PHT40_02660 [Patescibacteria group bacterium]|nr:hypothetical protein [Patescibacteria group bacterium]
MIRESDFVKIRITVPAGEAADKLRKTLGEAGAGIQGNYDFCSFSYSGIGRFHPLTGANPTIGEIGKFEEVPEELIETICHKEKLEQVLKAVKENHPYEEPAIDVVPLLKIE